MSTTKKLGLVMAGYVAACLLTSGAVYLYQLLTDNAAAQASAGMYAFGDLLLFVSMFGILALFPTALGLYFLFRALRKS